MKITKIENSNVDKTWYRDYRNLIFGYDMSKTHIYRIKQQKSKIFKIKWDITIFHFFINNFTIVIDISNFMWKMWFFTKKYKNLKKNRQKYTSIDAAHRDASNGGIFNLCTKKFEKKIKKNIILGGFLFLSTPCTVIWH